MSLKVLKMDHHLQVVEHLQEKVQFRMKLRAVQCELTHTKKGAQMKSGVVAFVLSSGEQTAWSLWCFAGLTSGLPPQPKQLHK